MALHELNIMNYPDFHYVHASIKYALQAIMISIAYVF